MSTFDGCPHCKNRIGFVFGTCGDCGFNYIDNTFRKIEVWVDDLPDDIKYYLILKHSERTHRE